MSKGVKITILALTVAFGFALVASQSWAGDAAKGEKVFKANCVFDQNLSSNIGLAFVSAGDALAAAPAEPEDQVKVEASLTFHF